MFPLSYQWYSNSKYSSDKTKMISGTTNSFYAVKSNEAKIGELKYYYAIVKGTYKNINLTPKVSQIASLTVKAFPKFVISWPTKQKDPELFGLLPASIAFEFSNQSSIKRYNTLTNND